MFDSANRDRSFPVLAAASDRSASPTPKPCILVVDDDSRLVEMMANWLQIDDYGATTTTDPLAALALAEQRGFDLAIVDITFPTMSGWDLIANLKRLQPHLKVIVWTGWDQSSFAASPAHSLVDGLLPKPSRLADLRRVLAQCLPQF